MQHQVWRTRVFVLLALAVVCGVSLEGEAQADVPCGLLDPVDALLCRGGSPPPPGNPPPPPSSSPSPEPGGSQPESSAAGSGSASSAGSVRRTGVKPELVPDLLHVRFQPRTKAATRAQVLAAAGATEERTIRQLHVTIAYVPPERLKQARASLERSRWVESVERDVVVQGIGGRRAFVPARHHGQFVAGGLSQSSTLVAVLDTGVDPSHPDLAGAVLAGYDFVNNDSDAADDHWHGTAVAGVLAGRTSQARGTCSTCVIVPVKVLAADGTGDTAGVAAGIVYAVNRGVRVINLSLGAPGTTQALDDAVAYAASRNVLVVAAAGNDGVSTPFYPAAHSQSVSVAGTTSSDKLYPWSNYGEWVAVAAQGCRPAPVPRGYAEFCGTSAAAPVVAGLAGGIMSSRPSTTATEVAQALETTALPIGPVVRYGRVRGDEALAALTPVPTVRTATLRGTLTPSRPSRVFVREVGAGPFQATLRFTGPSRLTLSLLDAAGATISKSTGRSPLGISTTLSAATYRLVVSGTRARATYTLVLSHA